MKSVKVNFVEIYTSNPVHAILKQIHFFIEMFTFNSFAANVADRRRHSRLPTSPIGDLDTHYIDGMQRHYY